MPVPTQPLPGLREAGEHAARDVAEHLVAGLAAITAAARPALHWRGEDGAHAIAVVRLQADLVTRGGEGSFQGGGVDGVHAEGEATARAE